MVARPSHHNPFPFQFGPFEVEVDSESLPVDSKVVQHFVKHNEMVSGPHSLDTADRDDAPFSSAPDSRSRQKSALKRTRCQHALSSNDTRFHKPTWQLFSTASWSCQGDWKNRIDPIGRYVRAHDFLLRKRFPKFSSGKPREIDNRPEFPFLFNSVRVWNSSTTPE